MAYILCKGEFLMVNMEEGLIKRLIKGPLGNAPDIFLHALPLPKTPCCCSGHYRHPLSSVIISNGPSFIGNIIKTIPKQVR